MRRLLNVIIFKTTAKDWRNLNPDLAKNRQEKVIRSMIEHGYLSQEEANNIQELN